MQISFSRRLVSTIAAAVSTIYLIPQVSGAASLAWDPNTDLDVAGYQVYVGQASRTYNGATNVGNVASWTISGASPGTTNFYAVTAYNSMGVEGDFSNEVQYVPGGGNQVPSISTISNQTIAEDGATPTLALTVGDFETPASSLVVTATSSNPTLVPTQNILLGGTGSNRTVKITPAANQSGSATIALTVSDGSASASSSFLLTANAVNDAPTISDISNKTISQSTSTGPIPFTVGDVETPVSNLSLTGSTSNPTLVPNGSIAFGGSGANRTVTVTPQVGQSGTVSITITVSDGASTASDSFTLTVNAPANTAPAISNIPDQTTSEDAATSSIAFVVGDAETAAGSLIVSGTSSNPGLVPNANIVFGGSGSNRTVSLTPAPNQNGTATITVSVSDGSLTASDTFILNVNAVNDTPTLDPIANRSVAQDSGSQTVSLTGISSGAPNESQTLSVTAVSSNPALIPNPSVTYISPDSTGTLTFTPVANATDTTTITVTVNDGQAQNNTLSSSFTVTVTNSAPSISNIPDQTTSEDAATSPIAFVVGDAETAAGSLIVSGTSSNPGLVPNANIVFGGSGSNRTVSLTPAPNQNGTATITVSVSDGSLTASDTFILNVNAVNDTPTLDPIANRSVAQDSGSQTVSLTGISSGAPNESQTLSVTAVSSNPALIPNPSVTYISPDSTGTLTFAPVGNDTGTATITVTVNDGQSQNNVFSQNFTVTVSSSNQPPTISSIADQATTTGSAVGPISFTVGDPEAAPSSLSISGSSSNLTLVPNADIIFGGSGSNRTVTVTPAADQTGSAVISVWVSDGALSSSTSFTVTVTGGSTPPIIALASPTNGSTYASPATFALAANVTDNGHTITRVQFYGGATLLGEVASAPYSLTWSNVTTGNYSLLARATYDTGGSVDSPLVNIAVSSLPAPWQTADIGTVGMTGSASESAGAYSVKGAGALNGTADSFRFVYQPLTADGEIRARLPSAENTGTDGSIGVMIRESLSPGSKYDFLGMLPDRRLRWQARRSTSGSTSTYTGNTTPATAWIRVTRVGNMVYDWSSNDGTNWTRVNYNPLSMATNIYIGFAVASGTTNILNTSTFTNVTAVP